MSSAEVERRAKSEKAVNSESKLPLTNTLDYRDQPDTRELYGIMAPSSGKKNEAPRACIVCVSDYLLLGLFLQFKCFSFSLPSFNTLLKLPWIRPRRVSGGAGAGASTFD